MSSPKGSDESDRQQSPEKEAEQQQVVQPDSERPTSWDVFVLYILTFSLLPLFLLSFGDISDSTERLMLTVDTAICIFLFVDFLSRYARSKNKLAFMRWGWLDLMGCIPFILVPHAEWIRWVRIFRLVIIIRRLGNFGYVVESLFHNPLAGTVYTTLMLGMLVVALGTELVYLAENGIEGSLIKGYPDALWWTITTVTTVGYGDIYPVSLAGRAVAAFLMLFGIALYGSVTTMIAQLLARAMQKSSRSVTDVMLHALEEKMQEANLNNEEKKTVVNLASEKVAEMRDEKKRNTQ